MTSQEKETTINFNEGDEIATVYTYNSAKKTRARCATSRAAATFFSSTSRNKVRISSSSAVIGTLKRSTTPAALCALRVRHKSFLAVAFPLAVL